MLTPSSVVDRGRDATVTEPAGLREQDLSAMFASANATSERGQRRTKLSISAELLLLILAAVMGLGTLRTGAAQLNWFALISAMLFIGSGMLTYVRSKSQTEQAWYVGRAGAESVKTLAWRYAVGGDPFPVSQPQDQVDGLYLHRLRQIFEELTKSTAIPPTPPGSHEITAAMRELRANDLATRRSIYRRHRIEDQRAWYQRRAISHARSAQIWLVVTIASSAVGVVFGFIKFLGTVDLDLLGVFGACATAAIAWNQLNQFRNLVSAYNVTAVELGLINERLDQASDEARWAAFVSDSEDAISREHTLWLARHGHPGLEERRPA
jgi:SMODS and SLOG-associating 2TM effector domain 3/SMODS and SLOG-associating 2TM effector domain 1